MEDWERFIEYVTRVHASTGGLLRQMYGNVVGDTLVIVNGGAHFAADMINRNKSKDVICPVASMVYGDKIKRIEFMGNGFVKNFAAVDPRCVSKKPIELVWTIPNYATEPAEQKQSGIHPIETVWHGYRFRSRLEARWAVAFEAMCIDWEYEPEGYVLDDGTWYLPDFLLHGIHGRSAGDVYVEVKGVMTEADKHKIEEFAKSKPVYVVGRIKQGNDRGLCCWYQFMRDVVNSGAENSYYYSFVNMDGDQFGAFLGVNHGGYPEFFGEDSSYLDSTWPVASHDAYECALQARFDHGETPESSTEMLAWRDVIMARRRGE